MKKMMIIIMMVLLMGCSVKDKFDGEMKQYISNDTIDLSDVNPNETTYEELLSMLGVADNYYFGDRQLDPDDLPKAFYMSYNEGATFRIRNSRIIEMRLEKETASYDETLYIGQDFEEALTTFDTEMEFVDGIHLYYKKDVVYTNIKGYDDEGDVGYYHDSKSDVRFWSYNGSVSNIYYVGNYDEQYRTVEKVIEAGNSAYYSYFGVNGEGFVDDPLVRGKWHYIDQVFDLEEFEVGTRRSTLEFTDLNCLRRGAIEKSTLAWTKGLMFNMYSPDRLKYTYDFVLIDDIEYLVLEQEGKYGSYFYIFERDVN